MLRATFSAGKGLPVEHISGHVPPVFEVLEPEGDTSASERRGRRRPDGGYLAREPFDLANGPLWRVRLIRVADQEHVLVIVMHHIVSDAWSFYVFGQELAELYDAAISDRPARLTELPIQYADFGQRQRQWLSGQVYEQQLAHWRSHLEGDVPRLLLPTDRPASAVTSHRGAFQTLVIPADVSQALGQLSRRESATMFMTLLAAFEVLLHGYSGQEDLVVCTPASGRHRSQAKELIGYFNNLLPMRFDLTGNPTFVEVLRRTRRVALDAFKYQDLPFQIIAELPNLRAVSLSRVLFSLDIEWPPTLALAGLESQAWAVRTDTADFDLSVSLWLAGDEIRGVFEYKTDLFDEETIAQTIVDYKGLIATLAGNPEIALRSLPARARPDADLGVKSAGRESSRCRPPNSPTELRIVTAWEEILGIRPIGLDDDLFELGGTSLAVARISERLAEMFPVALPLASIFQARTVRRIAALIRSGAPAHSWSALAPIRAAGSYPPLFLCEGIGAYYPLVHHLGSEQPVYGLVTEVAHDYPSVEDLAASYVKEVRELQPEGPYYLGGLSFGGIVAFEMAQQLVAAGQEVALPGVVRHADAVGIHAQTAFPTPARPPGQRAPVWPGICQVKSPPTVQTPRHGAALTTGSGGRARSATLADTVKLRHLLSTTAERYQLRSYSGCADLFVLAERDGMSDSLFDPVLGEIDPELGWGRVVTGGVRVYQVPGKHLSIFREPNVSALAEKLTLCLESARLETSK